VRDNNPVPVQSGWFTFLPYHYSRDR